MNTINTENMMIDKMSDVELKAEYFRRGKIPKSTNKYFYTYSFRNGLLRWNQTKLK